jgi:CO/xanthine dehydrogenase FAD-binding subunit
LRQFSYKRAGTIAEAVEILEKGNAKVLAGGTDLVTALRVGAIRPDVVVDVGRIPELRELDARDGALHVGAAVTFRELAASPLLSGGLRAVAQAAAAVGSPQIRAAGTVGGNIANASPAADVVVPLVALGSRVQVVGPCGQRTVDIDAFLGPNPGRVNLASDELIVKVIVPLPAAGVRSAFSKLGRRRALSIARLSCAVAARVDADGTLRDVRVAVGAAAPHPVRAPAVEAALEGSQLTEGTLSNALHEASVHVERIIGSRASMPYKREAIKGVIWEAVNLCLAPDRQP